MEGHEAIRLDHYAISYLGSPYAGTGRPRWMARLRDRRSVCSTYGFGGIPVRSNTAARKNPHSLAFNSPASSYASGRKFYAQVDLLLPALPSSA